jgi:MOSC domain-containing protein YiiM
MAGAPVSLTRARPYVGRVRRKNFRPIRRPPIHCRHGCLRAAGSVRVLSVNVGMPREVRVAGKPVLTSIFKNPVAGRIAVRRDNLDGDRQSDPSVHGGPTKAVYVYPSEHYPFWRDQLGIDVLPWGSFGENLTTEGLAEDAVHVGMRLRIGSAVFTVTQPRMPCFKLGIRFDRGDVVKRFLDSRRSGFYLAIASEGDVATGDEIVVLGTPESAVSIREVLGMYVGEEPIDRARLRVAAGLASLSKGWQAELRRRLQQQTLPWGETSGDAE